MVKKRKNKKKIISSVILIILLIIAMVVSYFVWDAYFKEDVDDEVVNEEVVVVDEDEPKIEVDEEVVKKEDIAQYDGENPNTSGGITGVITYAGLIGNNLTIRTSIDQYLSDGVCKLELVRGGEVIYSDSANIIALATTSTCEGFDVDASVVGGGNLLILIKIESGDKNGEIRGEVSL